MRFAKSVLIVAVIMAAIIPLTSQATAPAMPTLRAVAAVSHNLGWAVGDGGHILKWNGTVWTDTNSPTTSDLYAVFAVGDQHWAVGASGTLLGGAGDTWKIIGTNSSADLFAVAADGAGKIWAAGDGVLVRVQNGEASAIVLVPQTVAYAIAPYDGGIWLAGRNGLVAKYENSLPVITAHPTNRSIRAVVKQPGASGWWLFGDGGTIMFLRDTGRNLTIAVSAVTSPTSNDLYAAAFSDQATGLAVGSGGAMLPYSASGAGEWGLTTSSLLAADLRGVSVLGDGFGLLVGSDLTLLKLEGGSWTSAPLAQFKVPEATTTTSRSTTLRPQTLAEAVPPWLAAILVVVVICLAVAVRRRQLRKANKLRGLFDDLSKSKPAEGEKGSASLLTA